MMMASFLSISVITGSGKQLGISSLSASTDTGNPEKGDVWSIIHACQGDDWFAMSTTTRPPMGDEQVIFPEISLEPH